MADQDQLHTHCHGSNNWKARVTLDHGAGGSFVIYKEDDISSNKEVSVLPNRCKDSKGFSCHDGMCELPVVQQTRRDVVPITQRSDNIVVKQHPSKASAHSFCVGCIRIDATRKTGRSSEIHGTRWRNGNHKGQKLQRLNILFIEGRGCRNRLILSFFEKTHSDPPKSSSR